MPHAGKPWRRSITNPSFPLAGTALSAPSVKCLFRSFNCQLVSLDIVFGLRSKQAVGGAATLLFTYSYNQILT